MKKIKYLFFLLILFLGGGLTPCFSQESEKALLLTTIDYGYRDRWYRTLESDIPQFSFTDKVVKGQNFFIVLLFADYAVSSNSRAKISFDIKMTDPESKVSFHRENLPGADTLVNKKIILMAESQLGIRFDPEDPYGKYTIEVEIFDKIADEKYSLIREIELVEEIKPSPFSNDDEFSSWLTQYYTNPQPERLLLGYRYYMNSEMSKKDSTFPPVLGFYVEALTGNDYLIDQLISELNNENNTFREKIFYIFLLYYLPDKRAKGCLNALTGGEKEVYERLKEYPVNYLTDPIEDAGQLDYLWGAFFATGGYRHIFLLTEALELKEGNIMVYSAAKWSLGSNREQHSLVNGYLHYIYSKEKISSVIKKEIGVLIERKEDIPEGEFGLR